MFVATVLRNLERVQKGKRASDCFTRPRLRSTWKRTIGYIIGCALASAVIFTPEWGNSFGERVLYLLIVSFSVGILLWLDLPVIMKLTDRLPLAVRTAVRIAGAVLTANVGVAVGLGVLGGLQVFPWNTYGTRVWESMAPTAVIGLICVAGLTMYRTVEYRAKLKRHRRASHPWNLNFAPTFSLTR